MNALESADGKTKLPSNGGVRPGDPSHVLDARGTPGRQRNATAYRQTFHKKLPAVSRLFRTADDGVHRDHDIVAFGGTIVKRHSQWIVSTSENDPRRIRWNECERDAGMGAFTEQVFRVS